MEKRMAAAAGADSIQTPEMAEALGGSEQMPVLGNVAKQQTIAQPTHDDERDVKDRGLYNRELPDYRNVDSSGFLSDVWTAFWDDTKRIWRDRNTTEKL